MSTEYIYDPVVSEEAFLVAAKKRKYKPDYTEKDATKKRYPVGNKTQDNWIWVNVNKHGNVGFTRYGWGNNDQFIYDIAEELGVRCFCEHDDAFQVILDKDKDEEHGKFFRIMFVDRKPPKKAPTRKKK